MTDQPTALSSSLETLVAELTTADVAVIDFETTGTKHFSQIVGTGVYLPSTGRAFYINSGHGITDPHFPRYALPLLADALASFLGDPSKKLIAHNATFELRLLIRLGAVIRCQTSCTLVHTHRADENLRSHGTDRVSHYHTNVSYGLKELTTIYFGERPPSIMEATAGRSVVAAPPRDVAIYCVLDCFNTWRLYDRAESALHATPQLRWLTRTIDDPNMLALAKMMSKGILLDTKVAGKQAASYEIAVQNCRNEIWRLSGLNWPIETADHIRDFLRRIDYREIGYDPFYHPLGDWERDPSVAREVLLGVHDLCKDDRKRTLIALFIAKTLMEQRLNAFLKPLPNRVDIDSGRLYADSFSSTLVTTRFSTSPNLQNMPRTMGKGTDLGKDDLWIKDVPRRCRPIRATKDIFIAKPGHKLVSMDLSAAEPRYLSLLFQRTLKEKDGHLKVKVRKLNQLRKERYPELLKLMRQTAEPYKDRPHDDFIWPPFDEDPLYRVFKYGDPVDDPYNALLLAMDPKGHQRAIAKKRLAKWLSDDRWRGKRAFLALGYGSTAENLYKPLKWSLERTIEAIANIESTYATLGLLRELTLREVIQTGEVRSLWGRPRRLNGYYQLARPYPVTVGFYRMRPSVRTYEADIIPLGTTRQAVQAFVSECRIMKEDGLRADIVFAADPATGHILHRSPLDPFVNADHFNRLPFRNLNYSQINWVKDQDGLTRLVSKQARVQRQALNAMCQSTGADHLRWLMNNMDTALQHAPQFASCDLVLTVHDSLIYEVPNDLVTDFVAMARPVMQTLPPWSDISMKVGIEVGDRYGDMTKIPAP